LKIINGVEELEDYRFGLRFRENHLLVLDEILEAAAGDKIHDEVHRLLHLVKEGIMHRDNVLMFN
jgi:hypothetical protein